MSRSTRLMAEVQADTSIANMEDAELARVFMRRREQRYAAANARIREACFKSLEDPREMHGRAITYCEWLRTHLETLKELPGCGSLDGDPALDLVTEYLWWVESHIRDHYEVPYPRKP